MSYPVQFSQILFLLLVHHNVHTGDGFADHTDLAELGSRTTSDLGNFEGTEFGLQILELLGQLFFLLASQLGALDARLKKRMKTLNTSLLIF